MSLTDRINDDLTLDVECPVCGKTLPRRGVKKNVLGTHSFTCLYCSEDFDVHIEKQDNN